MESGIRRGNITLLFDSYSVDSSNLHTSFLQSGIECKAVAINDDGFIPENVESVYEYFLGGFDTTKKPRYFNQIDLPPFWQITANNTSGEIYDLNHLKGRIFYTKPLHKRLISVVEYLDENGKARFADHYNRYGVLYARSTCDKDGKCVLKTYFDSKGNEVIVENFVTGDIILNQDERVHIFKGKVEFVKFYLEITGQKDNRLFINSLGTPFFVSQLMGDNGKQDILFWQEGMRSDVPGNMKFIFEGNATRVGKVFVQKKSSYEALIKAGAPSDKTEKLGFVYDFVRQTKRRKEILICTNSDKIDNLEEIAKALPEAHFNVVALTEMSQKLMSMGKYENITLYPTARMHLFDKLFEKCDIYLDINRENEIVNAVSRAFLNNMIIMAYNETMHNANYIATENRYDRANVNALIRDIKEIFSSRAIWDSHLDMQYEHALSEKKEAYNIFE